MKKALQLFFFIAIFFTGDLLHAQTVVTSPPLNGGNGSGGTAFQVKTNATIIVTGFDAALQSSTQNIEIWYTSTDTTGPPNITVGNGWTQLGTASVTGQSIGLTPVLSAIPITLNLTLSPGTYRFYIGCASCSVVYTTWNSSNQQTFTDGIVTIETGTNIGYGGSIPNPTFHPRQFNGAINYIPASGLDLAPTAVTHPTTLGVGQDSCKAVFTNLAADTIYSFEYGYAFDGTMVQHDTITLGTPMGPGNSIELLFDSLFTVPAPGTYDIDVWVSNVNNLMAPDSTPANDTLTVQKCTGLAGNFVIDANGSGDYANFNDAVNAMIQCGISGPVTFDVLTGSGPYVEQVSIPEILGASSTNTITFNGNGNVLQFQATVSAERYTLQLDGADWVTVDSLTINSLSSTFGWGVHLTNGANNNNFTNNTITSNQVSTSTNHTPFVVSGSNTSNATATNANNNTVENNFIRGGYYGMRWNGSTGGLNVTGNVIRNNEVADFRLYGIYLDDTDGTTVEGNDINRANRVSVSTFYGVFLTAGNRNVRVNANDIHNSHGSASSLFGTSYPIYLSGCDAPFGEENYITNNVIYDINSNGTIYGIYNFSSDGSFYFNNTISLDHVASTGGTTRGIFSTSTLFNVQYKNNIISITRGGSGTKHGIYNSATASFYDIDHNNVYMNSAGTGQQHYGFNGGNQTNLTDWQNSNGGYGANSLDANPGFANLLGFDFHLAGFSNPLHNLGDTITGILDADHDGAIRNLNSPDPGAYEYIANANVSTINSPVTGCFLTDSESVNIEVQNVGPDTLAGFDVAYTINGGTPVIETINDTVFPGTFYTYVFNTTADFSVPGAYDLNVFVLNSGGVLNQVIKYAPPVINLGPDTIICQGFTLTLDAENIGSTYNWSTGSTNQTVDISSTQNVTVTVTTVDGCVDSQSRMVNVSDPQINLGPDTSICENSAIVLDAGIPGSTYNWNTGNANQFQSATANNTYSVQLTDSAGCQATDTIVVGSIPAPVASFTSVITPVWNFAFTNTSTGGTTYFWDFGDGNTDTDPNPTHTYTTRPDSVVVTLIVSNDCGQSTFQNTYFNVGVGIDLKDQIESSLVVYPNPNNGSFTISMEGVNAEEMSIELVNAFGQIVQTENFTQVKGSFSHPMELKEYAAGVYFIRIHADGQIVNHRMVVK